MSSEHFDNLPTEIIAQILLYARHCIQYRDNYYGSRDIGHRCQWKLPIAAMCVCKLWHSIVLTTPFFWSDVRVISITTQEDLLVLDRSATLPLTLWVEGGGVGNRAALSHLSAQSARWEGLFIANRPMSEATHPDTTILYDGDVREWVTLRLPALRYLHIGGISIQHNVGSSIALSLPALESAAFGWTVPAYYFPESPNLKSLALVGCHLPMRTLVRYLAEGRESLRSLMMEDGVLADSRRLSNPWPEGGIKMPLFEELSFRLEGYSTLLRELLINIRCPSIRSITYHAPKDEGTPWTPPVSPPLDFPLLTTLDLQAGQTPMSSEAFNDIIIGSPNLRILATPFLTEGCFQVLLAHPPLNLYELRVRSVVPIAWLRSIVEVIPGIGKLDLTGGNGGGRVQDSDTMIWLQEHVPEIQGMIWRVHRVSVDANNHGGGRAERLDAGARAFLG